MFSLDPSTAANAGVLAHYRALREQAGCVDRRSHGQLLLTGADRRGFLQGLLTNDIQALAPGTGCYAAMLTANGRMIADMRILELGDAVLLDTEASLAEPLRERLDQMLFSEDVQIENVSATRCALGVYGPLAARIVARVIAASEAAVPSSPLAPGEDLSAIFSEAGSGNREATDAVTTYADRLEALPRHANLGADSAYGRLVVVRSEDVGVAGFELFVETTRADALRAAILAAGAVAVAPEVVEITRIEAGHPVFGRDMNEDTIPLEAGIGDRAISLTKGCYVGQEIIIRVLHRGHGRVARRLVGLTFDASASSSSPGDVIRSGERQLGVVTSATFSPALQRPIALGYVQRDFAEPGTPVTVAGAAAVVTALPFV